MVALVVGGIVAGVSIWLQTSISEDQASQATRLENLRFVRQLSSESGVVARPFSGFDLQGETLEGLDLRGAVLRGANLQHAYLGESDLSPTPSTRAATAPLSNRPGYADLRGTNLSGADLVDANLTGANLMGADLTGANLTGADLTDATGLDKARMQHVVYDEHTKWPAGFVPPPR